MVEEEGEEAAAEVHTSCALSAGPPSAAATAGWAVVGGVKQPSSTPLAGASGMTTYRQTGPMGSAGGAVVVAVGPPQGTTNLEM